MNNSQNQKSGFTRRQLLGASAALPLFSIGTGKANAAEFTYKLATGQDPAHPVNKRAQEAIDRIRTATGGRLEIRLFPANQLGSDTDLLSQVRSGGVEFFNQASVVLSTLVPAAGIVNTGFAFSDYDQVWKAMDGPLGAYVRAQIEKIGLLTMSKPWDNGFRNVTTSTKPVRNPDDLRGLKLRVPAAPMLSSLFTALGSSPTPIKVQKYCSMTNHVWDAYWILGNRKAVERLPKDIQAIVRSEFERSATDERADIASLSLSLRSDLSAKGLQLIEPDKKAFKDALGKTSFYKDLRAKFGDEAWKLLQDSVGSLG